jgi:transposase
LCGRANVRASPLSVEAWFMRKRHARGTEEVRPRVPRGGVRIVRETGKPIVEVARDLGIHPGTLGNWVNKDRLARGEDTDPTSVDPEYVRRLERENTELRMERDVLKRYIAREVYRALPRARIA